MFNLSYDFIVIAFYQICFDCQVFFCKKSKIKTLNIRVNASYENRHSIISKWISLSKWLRAQNYRLLLNSSIKFHLIRSTSSWIIRFNQLFLLQLFYCVMTLLRSSLKWLSNQYFTTLKSIYPPLTFF